MFYAQPTLTNQTTTTTNNNTRTCTCHRLLKLSPLSMRACCAPIFKIFFIDKTTSRSQKPNHHHHHQQNTQTCTNPGHQWLKLDPFFPFWENEGVFRTEGLVVYRQNNIKITQTSNSNTKNMHKSLSPMVNTGPVVYEGVFCADVLTVYRQHQHHENHGHAQSSSFLKDWMHT